MMSKPITEDKECIICYTELDGTNDIQLKNCGHVFHKDCLENGLHVITNKNLDLPYVRSVEQ